MTPKEAAKKYLSEGKSVIPTNGKIPLVKWEEFQTRLVNEETIEMWFEQMPTANIGIVTGKISGITVIDVDGEKGQASLKTIFLPPTYTVKTPKGWHLYFKYHPDYPQGVGILPGIDIRNNGGFVVAPPSIINELFYETVADVEYAELPAVETVFKRKLNTPVHEFKNPQWVEELLKAGTKEPGRNHSATKLAGHYRAKNINAAETFEILKSFAEKCTPPMDLNELWNTIQSVYRYAVDIHTVTINEEPDFTEMGDTFIYKWPQYGLEVTLENLTYDSDGLRCTMEILIEYPGIPTFHSSPENINLASSRTKASAIKHLESRFKFDWATVFDMVSRRAIYQQREGEPFKYISNTEDFLEQPLWLLEPFVTRAGLSLLFAKGDSGKSLVSLAILLSIQTGIPILGKKPEIITKGLYLDWESNDNSLRKRLRFLTKGHNLPEILVAYQDCSIGFPLLLRRIRKRIIDDKIGFIVLDAVSGASGDDIIRQDVTANFANAARSLGIPMLLISHTKKGGDKEEVGEAYGSVYWFNESRTVMELRTEQEEGIPESFCHFYHRKNNDGMKVPRFGFKTNFSADSIAFSSLTHKEFLASSSDNNLSVKDRIMLTLQTKDKTATEIATDTGIKLKSIRLTLDRHLGKAFIISRQGDKHNEHLWSIRNKAFLIPHFDTSPLDTSVDTSVDTSQINPDSIFT